MQNLVQDVNLILKKTKDVTTWYFHINYRQTCKKCQYQFCWLCLQPWTAHDTSKCNMYEVKLELYIKA